MPGTAAFPEPASTTLVNGSKDDDVKGSIGSKVSAAKFVDNSIHHGIYERSTDTITGQFMSISRPSSTDYQVTHGRTYSPTEEEGGLVIRHATAHGVDDTISPFFNDTKLITGVTPPILLFNSNQSIRCDSVTTASEGSRIGLRNMEGRTLSDLGFDSESGLQAGQKIEVGLRTTDLSMRLFRDKMNALNSISISAPIRASQTEEVTTYKGAGSLRHSMEFLSSNFKGNNIGNVLRFLARHDNYTLLCDRFGNFIYSPDGFSHKDRKITDITSQSVSRQKIVDAANRVVVSGNSKAINDDIQAVVDDMELQKRDGIIKTMKVTDPTVNTRSAARRSGVQILRLNKKAQDTLKSRDLMTIWDLYPGDIVDYDSLLHSSGETNRSAIIEISHDLTGRRSDVTLLSYELGIEKVLVDLGNLTEDLLILDNDSPHFDYSSVGDFTIKGKVTVNIRRVSATLPRNRSTPGAGDDSTLVLSDSGTDKHSRFLIGHRKYSQGEGSGRSAIGTGLTPRLTGGTYDSPNIVSVDTTSFPSSGDLILSDDGNDVSHVSYTGKTSATFTGVSLQAGLAIPTGTGALDIRLLRGRGHEIGDTKGKTFRRKL